MGMIYGRVQIAGTHQPVCGVRVSADSDRQPKTMTRTVRNGSYNFYSIIPGKERVTVGRDLEAVYITVSANLTTDAPTVYLRHMPRSLRCGNP